MFDMMKYIYFVLHTYVHKIEIFFLGGEYELNLKYDIMHTNFKKYVSIRTRSCAIDFQTESILAQNEKLKFPIEF